VVIIERGPKVGVKVSKVYKTAIATPTSFTPELPQVSLGSFRPKDSRANNTEERSSYYIIILTCKGALK
jgi:hypothetical protein